MAFRSEQVRLAVHDFDFRRLFIEELGWDRPPGDQSVEVEGRGQFDLEAVAEKSGLVAYVCRNTDVPERAVRMKIERQLAKQTHEHLLVFVDGAATRQVWQWVKRQPGRSPLYREHTFHQGQTGEPLIQKLELLAFSLDEEPSIAQVAGLAGRAFDVDRVTKRFYTRFKTEHDAFLEFVDGIPVADDREWYTSLMLDRLMFIYFVQKKGFLDGDRDYLRNRLESVQRLQGQGKFLTFYQYFLQRFFHKGLGGRPEERTAELDALIGDVPYLNGGIFDVHELEQKHPDIQIEDPAFERLFDFFDAYQWHLDERPLRADDEINPDVLGYIFEKYVNQKQMGAYYTKEDITGYIAQNTVIPRLFDMARKDCAIAFRRDSALWRLLSENPDRYIYPAVQKGVDKPLPEYIGAGVDDVPQRGRWNEPADDAHALPTETWREHVARRQRHDEIWEKLVAGEVHQINDLITLNLDIRQFAQDAILDCEGPDLLRAFWKAIRQVSVLDPACGSGAFLFAALNVLEPLYDACLERMEAFVDELDHSRTKHSPAKFSDFREYLSEVRRHPNRRYFVLKSIIIGNLYGVDIMEEAVEICKLRLFLKLAAQAGTVDELEPLPDIDFNIRAGNTLVGFTSLEDVRRAMTVMPDGQYRQVFPEDQVVLNDIEEQAELANRIFDRFRGQQTIHGGEVTAADKDNLRQRLGNLSDNLDRYLASEYFVDLHDPDAYAAWHHSHKPFHWFVEFYGIMSKGRFDVIIGNPPYVEYSKIRKDYQVKQFMTERCGNLYAMMVERSFAILGRDGRFGMIVQLSYSCTERMEPVQKLSLSQGGDLWLSHFDDRPAKLFDGLEHIRATIALSGASANGGANVHSTAYNRWYAESRPQLFDGLTFASLPRISGLPGGTVPKLGSAPSSEILKRMIRKRSVSDLISRLGNGRVYFHNAPQYWVRAMDFAPYFWNERDGEQISSHVKTLSLQSESEAAAVVAALNSTAFYWWFLLLSNCRDLSLREVESFPLGLDQMHSDTKYQLASLTGELMQSLRHHSQRKVTRYRSTGKVIYDEFDQKPSKPIVDKIDRVLAKHYGFTDEELDFIINYDIKYRMGRSG